MTNTIKGLLNTIEEVRELGQNLLVKGLEPMLLLTNDRIYVKNFEELKQCSYYIANLEDVLKSDYDDKRLDAYYKNGRKAITIFIQE